VTYSALYREETPLPCHAREDVRAPLHEAQAGARNQILDGARDEHLASRGARRYPGADVDGDASHVVVAHQLALAGVQPRPDFDPQRADAVADGAGAANRPRGAVEGGEEAVPRGVDLSAPMPFELPPHDPVMGVEEGAPWTVAQCRGALGRAHDVG
jgi:hypothetical protein